MPPTPSPNPMPNDSVCVKLRGAWRRDRLAAHLAGAAWLIKLTIPLALALFALDWLLLLPRPARWALLAIAVGVVVWQMNLRWLRRLVRFDELTWAGRVEHAFPELNSLLISYVELARPKPAATGATALFAVVRRQAADAVAPLDFKKAVDLRTLTPLYKRAGAALAVFTLVLVLAPTHITAALQRYLGMDVRYPTATRFVEVPSGQVIGRGTALTLSATVAGQIPKRGKAWVRPDGGAWRAVSIDRVEESDAFAYTLDHVAESFDFYLAIGDARSHDPGVFSRIEVIPPPAIVSQTVRVTPPAYTGLAPFEKTTLAGTIPEGSEIAMTLTVDRDLQNAALLNPEDAQLPGELDADKRTVRYTWTPPETGVYHLELTAVDLGMKYTSDPYKIRLTEDLAPAASLLAPTRDMKATVNKQLPLTVRASDDYGIAEMAIVYQLGDDTAWRRVPLGQPPAPEAQKELTHARSGTWPVQWSMLADIPNLQPGDRVRVAMEVTEVAATPEAARRVVTESREIEILSKAEYQAYIVAQLETLRHRVGKAEQDQQLIRHEVDAIRGRKPANQDQEASE